MRVVKQTIKNCKICGKELIVTGNKKICDDCNKSTCKYCGNEVYRQSGKLPTYCSVECKNNGKIGTKNKVNNDNKTNKECLSCGNTFETYITSDKKFCCNDCYYIYKKGKPNDKNKTGKYVNCLQCGKEVYKPLIQIKDNNFCSVNCHNDYQSRNKVEIICKICGKHVLFPKSRHQVYCSVKCRIKDVDRLQEIAIIGNLAQQNKVGLNKLELKGREILQDIGLILNEDFVEQELMFNKFLVDVVLHKHKLVIQWDGVYWHDKPKRKKLDISQDAYMKKCGYEVIRITDKQIKQDERGVYDIIKERIGIPTDRIS